MEIELMVKEDFHINQKEWQEIEEYENEYRKNVKKQEDTEAEIKQLLLLSKSSMEIIYVFLTIFLYLLKCPQSLILSALRAFCFCGKPHISRSIFLYFRYQAWLKSW